MLLPEKLKTPGERQKMGARVRAICSTHAVMVSHPIEVAEFITLAVESSGLREIKSRTRGYEDEKRHDRTAGGKQSAGAPSLRRSFQ
jgi:hypothetical protein